MVVDSSAWQPVPTIQQLIDNGNGSRDKARTGPPDPVDLANHSVVREPVDAGVAPVANDFIFTYMSVADEIPQWGTAIHARDFQLRLFWPNEPLVCSGVYSVASKYSGFQWYIEGPPRTVGQVQRALQSVERGAGWIALWMKVLTDMFTQDNGAFTEVVRTRDDPSAPFVTMNHLDSSRCVRTGWFDAPVIYYDSHGVGHLLKWYQVIDWTEFPCPIERYRGIQYSAITRLLRAAQTMRDISVFEREKISGRFNRVIWLVSGPTQASIKDMMAQQQMEADQVGLVRYIQPLVIAALDPTSPVKVEKIDIATLPDGYDKEQTMRWYIIQLALAFGGDFQDFAPLPGGNLTGTGSSSSIMHMKSRGKGSNLFMSMVQHKLNFYGIIPNNCRFMYQAIDIDEENGRSILRLNRAKERQVRIMSGELSVAMARQIAADDGDLRFEYLEKLNAEPTGTAVMLPADDTLASDPGIDNFDEPDEYTGEDHINDSEDVLEPTVQLSGSSDASGAARGSGGAGTGGGGGPAGANSANKIGHQPGKQPRRPRTTPGQSGKVATSGGRSPGSGKPQRND